MDAPVLEGSKLRFAGEVTGLTNSRFDNDRAAACVGVQVQRGGLTAFGGASVGLITASEDFGAKLGAIYTFDLARLLGAEE
jgi:hypothetical protein